MLIHPHQLCHAFAFGYITDHEIVSLHHSPVIVLVDLAQFRVHCGFIIEIGKAGVRVESMGIQNGLGGLPYFLSERH